LTDPATGLVDDVELLAYVGSSVRYLANRYQLMHFVALNRALLTTAAGVESYRLPPSYGFVAPAQTRESGLLCNTVAGDEPTNLEWVDPTRYELIRSTDAGKPTQFTLAQGTIYLRPTPDQAYRIEAVERAQQFDAESAEIPDPYVAAVSVYALFRLASDMGRATPLLGAEVTELVKVMVNNEQRSRQKFYTSRERVGRWGTRRRGR
jgi:hypothetical protein